jgi:hypothetical protein
MVWHKTKQGARYAVSKHRMRKQLSKSIKEYWCQPTLVAVANGVRPMNDRLVEIVFPWQSSEMISIRHDELGQQ